MKLITILFLCSRLLSSLCHEHTIREIDCDDQDAFLAVDAALKAHNDHQKSGNQFVLYRITQVNKTNEERPFFLIFNYEIKEGNCPVQNGKTWQDCDYKESPPTASGTCTATVRKELNDEFTVSSQNCQIIPGEGPMKTHKYQCVGCMHPISTEDPDLELILKHNIQHFNNHSSSTHLFALKKVQSAQRQVVHGWNYDIAYLIEQTNCSKENFPFLTSECQPLLNGASGECKDNASVNVDLKVDHISQKCHLFPEEDPVPPPKRMCAGCPKEIPVDSPELEEALNHSLRMLNAENNGEFLFKIAEVQTAKVQVVAGMKYIMTFIAKETTCSKGSNIELIKNCELNQPETALHCNAEVVIVPWENKVYPTVNCSPDKVATLLRRPPGFSPFRSVGPIERPTRPQKSCEYKGRREASGATVAQ
ncbi:kininogen-1 [Sorex araneus]|uniref:kininogen-1 n=1 Tax=Sorex araneus TaxID=42254 RepID=UPI002433F76F|nr:kininogen-1 [Sorex araneus]